MIRNVASGVVYKLDEETLCLGRNRLTKVKDLRCSRKQVAVSYRRGDNFATLVHTGRHCCAVNGRPLIKGGQTPLYDGDTFELLPQKYAFRFELLPSVAAVATASTDAAEMEVNRGGAECKTATLCDSRRGCERSSTEVDGAADATALFDGQWTMREDVLMSLCPPPANYTGKVAGFDLDGTLIVTKSGRKFPKDSADWQVAFPQVPGKLKALHRDGYRLVVFSNQKGLRSASSRTGSDMAATDDFRRKLGGIRSLFKVPMSFFVATDESVNRKPRPGMWLMMEQVESKSGVGVDRRDSFFVGDAAGRLYGSVEGVEHGGSGKGYKDHSCSDRLFALNVGVTFFTPESFFVADPPHVDRTRFALPAFDPRPRGRLQLLPTDVKLKLELPQLIVMVGYPASGKSHFIRTHLVPLGFVGICRDELKSVAKCVHMADSYLNSGRSVVIDSTNPTPDSRQVYVSVARKYNALCRCFVMNVSYDQARHNDMFRRLMAAGALDRAHAFVPTIVLNSYRARFVEPSISEGFAAVVPVNFVPHFTDKRADELYHMFLVES